MYGTNNNYNFLHENQGLLSNSAVKNLELDNPYYTYNYDYRTMSNAGSFSPSSMDSSQAMDLDGIPITEEQIMNFVENNESPDIENTCSLKIIVQPVEKFRFRYKSEMMGTHGSLLGEKEDSNHRKEVPTVQLINCPFKKAVIRCTIVTADEDRRFPHAHHLVRKNGNIDSDDPHDIEVTEESNYVAMFCNMGIIHTAKKNIKEEIMRKKKTALLEEKKRNKSENLNITTTENLQMKMEAEKAQKWMNLNSVALCFQGFRYGDNDVLYPITKKVYSRAINNLKSALTGELKICRIDKPSSSCEGNEEIWLLVEKVGKKNIKVKLYEVDNKDNPIWEADGRFTELDVHHQYAIVFKTPPYKDVNISKPKEVLLRLERPSDGEYSNSITFVYKPTDKALNRKRPRFDTDSVEFSKSTPSLEECAPMSETFLNLNLNHEEINSLSGELKKLLNENNAVPPEELKEFIENFSGLEQYLSLPFQNSELVPDGVAVKSHETFAAQAIKKVVEIFKVAEVDGNKEMAIIKVKKVIEETVNCGDTPLHSALRFDHFDIAKSIIKVISSDSSFEGIVNIRNSDKKTPLHLAIWKNQPEIVRALLKLGADPDLSDEEDATSYHTAVKENATDCLDELLKSDRKINLEAHTESGWSALHLAAKRGSWYAVKALVEAGADVNATDMSYGRTALHIAVDHNHKHIVEYLLNETKIDVNKKNFGGNVALHAAVVKGGECAEELVKILKKHGADPSIRNNNINNDEEDHHNDLTIQHQLSDVAIKSESSDSEDGSSRPRQGESSFDLARDDPTLMQLLSNGKPASPIEEELDLKEESDDEIALQDRAIMQIRKTIAGNFLTQAKATKDVESPTKLSDKERQKQTLEKIRRSEEKLTDAHVKRITGILDKTGGWIKLAQETDRGGLVRLYRKTTSPSSALFNKIRLQEPDITVSKVKKLLIEINAFEAASALEKK